MRVKKAHGMIANWEEADTGWWGLFFLVGVVQRPHARWPIISGEKREVVAKSTQAHDGCTLLSGSYILTYIAKLRPRSPMLSGPPIVRIRF